MNWKLQQVAHYLGPVRLQVEFQGISEEGFQAAFRQEALRRLDWVEAVIFSEELTDQQKIQTLQQEFLA